MLPCSTFIFLLVVFLQCFCLSVVMKSPAVSFSLGVEHSKRWELALINRKKMFFLRSVTHICVRHSSGNSAPKLTEDLKHILSVSVPMFWPILLQICPDFVLVCLAVCCTDQGQLPCKRRRVLVQLSLRPRKFCVHLTSHQVSFFSRFCQ